MKSVSSSFRAGEAFDGAIFEKPVSLNITITVRVGVMYEAVGLTRNHPVHFSFFFFL